jgi:hypothetical protein
VIDDRSVAEKAKVAFFGECVTIKCPTPASSLGPDAGDNDRQFQLSSLLQCHDGRFVGRVESLYSSHCHSPRDISREIAPL